MVYVSICLFEFLPHFGGLDQFGIAFKLLMADRGWRTISLSFGHGTGIAEVLRSDKCVLLDGKNMPSLRTVLKRCGLKKKYSEP